MRPRNCGVRQLSTPRVRWRQCAKLLMTRGIEVAALPFQSPSHHHRSCGLNRQEKLVTRYRTTVSSKWDLDRTFYYVSDFSHCSQWNPDVTSSLQISAGEVGLGTKFDLIANINGR